MPVCPAWQAEDHISFSPPGLLSLVSMRVAHLALFLVERWWWFSMMGCRSKGAWSWPILFPGSLILREMFVGILLGPSSQCNPQHGPWLASDPGSLKQPAASFLPLQSCCIPKPMWEEKPGLAAVPWCIVIWGLWQDWCDHPGQLHKWTFELQAWGRSMFTFPLQASQE